MLAACGQRGVGVGGGCPPLPREAQKLWLFEFKSSKYTQYHACSA